MYPLEDQRGSFIESTAISKPAQFSFSFSVFPLLPCSTLLPSSSLLSLLSLLSSSCRFSLLVSSPEVRPADQAKHNQGGLDFGRSVMYLRYTGQHDERLQNGIRYRGDPLQGKWEVVAMGTTEGGKVSSWDGKEAGTGEVWMIHTDYDMATRC